MSEWQKWSDRPPYDSTSERLLCCLMVSRNKDNQGVPGFRERRRASLVAVPRDVAPITRLAPMFETFVSAGVPQETSRLYVSVNARDNLKVRRALLERLIFDDSLSMGRLEATLCSVAARKECAAERQWLLDVDPDPSDPRMADDGWFDRLVADVVAAGDFAGSDVRRHKTPHGYAIVVPHGFDTRRLMTAWHGIVTLKRDDLLCVDWGVCE